jgi:hypothetical protein
VDGEYGEVALEEAVGLDVLIFGEEESGFKDRFANEDVGWTIGGMRRTELERLLVGRFDESVAIFELEGSRVRFEEPIPELVVGRAFAIRVWFTGGRAEPVRSSLTVHSGPNLATALPTVMDSGILASSFQKV